LADTSLIQSPLAVLAVLLAVLGALFAAARQPAGKKIFSVIPLLVFAYFVPTILSNTGVIPTRSPLYDFIKVALLPASLVLLTLSVDVKAIARLGKPALTLFFVSTVSIVIGGPLAYLALKWMIPAELSDQAWRGLAALAGSWIGGTANFTAIGESVGVVDGSPMYTAMIVVDVAVASIWMAVLLLFAGREHRMDARVGADRTTLDTVRGRVETYRAEVSRPTSIADLMLIGALGLGITAVATWLAGLLPELGEVVSRFTWIVVLATTGGLLLSFTRLRDLEGAGASDVGSVFLFLLIGSIGAKADFAGAFQVPSLLAVGFLWMAIHAACILAAWRLLRLPIFFAAVGSQANVGGAASAPIVAGAFHPALAPVGVLLAVGGYVLGTYAALLCAFLLQLVA
jgi:uncharacterized membrane protein